MIGIGVGQIIQRWKTKRELRKAIKIARKLCDEAPISFFENMIYDKDNKPLPPHEALNSMLEAIRHMEREL